MFKAIIGIARTQDRLVKYLMVTGAAALIVGLVLCPFRGASSTSTPCPDIELRQATDDGGIQGLELPGSFFS